MTNYLALGLYTASFLSGLAGGYLGVRELPARIKALESKAAGDPELPMLFNAHEETVQALLAHRSPLVNLQETRGALNEIIGALQAEVAARRANDQRLADLLAAPDNSWRLFLAVLAVVLATFLGGAGDLVATLNWHPWQGGDTSHVVHPAERTSNAHAGARIAMVPARAPRR